MNKKKKKGRRMPQHIVLPNGMWRFVKRGSKTKRKKAGGSMARKKKSYSRRGGMSRISLQKGIFPVGGILASALIGAGAATLQEKFAPQVIPYQGVAAGFAVGGIGGAIGAAVRDILKVSWGQTAATSNY